MTPDRTKPQKVASHPSEVPAHTLPVLCELSCSHPVTGTPPVTGVHRLADVPQKVGTCAEGGPGTAVLHGPGVWGADELLAGAPVPAPHLPAHPQAGRGHQGGLRLRDPRAGGKRSFWGRGARGAGLQRGRSCTRAECSAALSFSVPRPPCVPPGWQAVPSGGDQVRRGHPSVPGQF